MVTLTARPASGMPRVGSACFIRMPGTLEMPPDGKSAGSLNMISTVWLAGRLLSVLRRSDQVMVSLRSGISTSARIASSGGWSGPGDHGLGAPDRRADEALAVRIGRILLVQHDLLRHRGAGADGGRRRLRRAAGLDPRLLLLGRGAGASLATSTAGARNCAVERDHVRPLPQQHAADRDDDQHRDQALDQFAVRAARPLLLAFELLFVLERRRRRSVPRRAAAAAATSSIEIDGSSIGCGKSSGGGGSRSDSSRSRRRGSRRS